MSSWDGRRESSPSSSPSWNSVLHRSFLMRIGKFSSSWFKEITDLISIRYSVIGSGYFSKVYSIANAKAKGTTH